MCFYSRFFLRLRLLVQHKNPSSRLVSDLVQPTSGCQLKRGYGFFSPVVSQIGKMGKTSQARIVLRTFIDLTTPQRKGMFGLNWVLEHVQARRSIHLENFNSLDHSSERFPKKRKNSHFETLDQFYWVPWEADFLWNWVPELWAQARNQRFLEL